MITCNSSFELQGRENIPRTNDWNVRLFVLQCRRHRCSRAPASPTAWRRPRISSAPNRSAAAAAIAKVRRRGPPTPSAWTTSAACRRRRRRRTNRRYIPRRSHAVANRRMTVGFFFVWFNCSPWWTGWACWTSGSARCARVSAAASPSAATTST